MTAGQTLTGTGPSRGSGVNLSGPSLSGISNSDQATSALFAAAGNAGTTGAGLLQKGQDVVNPVLKYYTDILSGDKSAAFRAVAPQAQTITDQYDTAYKSVLEKAPRGGGRTSAAVNLKSAEAGAVGNLINEQVPQAAQQLSQIMQSFMEAGISLDEASLSSLASGLNSLLTKEGMDAQALGGLGGGLGSLLAALVIH